MASVKLEHIYKVYTGGVKAVSDLTMEMKDGEFIVLVGPSGCGKSTTLRMIAGLEEITAGELYIGDQIVNDMEPKDRDIAMVFQNYALYPQMTVYENMAFGLKLRHVPNDVIQSKVMWAANILGLTELLDRKPKAMSGGQRQRVALGRAILRDPKVMLLDEPLSNLDAKLRASMRTEIAKLHQKLKTTFVYVTHDQTEAMTLGDRVLVIKGGRMQQFDTPKNLYNYPENKFVAGFIGTPQMNFFDGYLTKEGDAVKISFDKAPEIISVPFKNLIKVNPAYLDGKHHVTVGVRCEHVHLVPRGTPNSLQICVNHFEELGAETLIYGSIGAKEEESVTDSSVGIIIRMNAKPENLKAGDLASVVFDVDHTYFFDAKTEESIVPRIPKSNAFTGTLTSTSVRFLDTDLALPAQLVADISKKLPQGGSIGATILVPNDAFLLSDHGQIQATVVKTEMVNTTPLLHLSVGDRTFFVLAGQVLEAGSHIGLDIDWSRVSIVADDGTHLVDPVQSFDQYHAAFFNYKTIQGSDKNPKYPQFVKIRQDRIDEVKRLWGAKIAQSESDFARTLDSVTPAEFKKLLADGKDAKSSEWKALVRERRAEAEEKDRVEISGVKEQMSALKTQCSTEIASLKAAHKAKNAEIKASNRDTFAHIKAQEVADYRHFLETNKDRDTIRRRKAEYHIFRDTFADQKNNALEQALRGEQMVFDNSASKIKAETKRQLKTLSKKILDIKEETKRAVDPATYLIDKHRQELKELSKQANAAVAQAGLIFFFGIGDYHFPSTPVISGKLIQGLGTRVFTKNYLLEVPHDAYKLSQTDGIQAIVHGYADYGVKKFTVVGYFDADGQERVAYLLLDQPLEVGAHVLLDIDITKTRITETGMGIRLY